MQGRIISSSKGNDCRVAHPEWGERRGKLKV